MDGFRTTNRVTTTKSVTRGKVFLIFLLVHPLRWQIPEGISFEVLVIGGAHMLFWVEHVFVVT
jgi:hypothetical protein